MKLSNEQETQVRHWIEQGMSLSDLQKALDEQLGVKLTYMDTRFLVDDLNLALKEKAPPPEEKSEAAAAPSATDQTPPQAAPDSEGGLPTGSVSVSVDRIVRPGALASGDVVFSDGTKAGWQLDQAGRLGLSGVDKTYRPSNEDLQEFQLQLQQELSKSAGI